METKNSYWRCVANPNFLGRFYGLFTTSHPAVGRIFKNTDLTRHRERLQKGLLMLILYAGGKEDARLFLEEISRRHGKREMNRDPNLYQFWLDSLVETIRLCDPEFSPQVEMQWRELMRKGISTILSQG
ncbi:MAG: hypothetical protein ACE5J1_05555 [Nitrospiria bacterium]